MSKLLNKIISLLKIGYRQVRYLYRAFGAKNWGQLPPKSKSDEKSVLFLLPEAGIKSYINTLVLIASQLRLLGIKVYFVRCFNIFERCMFMDSESLNIDANNQDKKFLCTYCFSSFEKNVIAKGFEFFDLRHFISNEDREYIQNIIAAHNQPFDFSCDDINFSGILEYNFFLHLKKASLSDLSEVEVKLWQQQLFSLYVGYQGVNKLLQQFGITHVVMYDQYSFNSIIKILASKLNITHTNVTIPFHKDVDPTRIRIISQDAMNQEHHAISEWPRFKNLHLSKNQIKEVADDLIVKMSKRGTYSYSPSKSASQNMVEQLNLDPAKKTIIAYPSSPDEADSMINIRKRKGLSLVEPNDAFVDQFEWLDDLINYTENSKEFQLVIRLHPRMAPNHREKWGCPIITDFVEKYSKPYQHVKIIWPEDKISSFDLAEIADVVTIAWSSMGIFMARLGIPVVSGLKMSLALPNEEFLVFCRTKETYFNSINLLAKAKISPQRLKDAYRWYHMMYLGDCVDLSDIVHQNPELNEINKLSKNSSSLANAIMHHHNVLEMNLQNLKNNQIHHSVKDENQALLMQVHRLIHFFITNIDTSSIISVKDNIVMEGYHIEYSYKGELYVKYSPMIARLVLLTQELAHIESQATELPLNSELAQVEH